MTMEIVTMGRVTVRAKMVNLEDLFDATKNRLPMDQVRFVEVSDALVDTGATMLSLPRKLVERLGLRRQRTRTARTSAGIVSFGVYEPVRLIVQDRECTIEVTEIPDDCPVLIGQVPLELLDFVVDPVNQRLIGNPEHGGEQMIDMF
jgi:predicted aspartyl protease